MNHRFSMFVSIIVNRFKMVLDRIESSYPFKSYRRFFRQQYRSQQRQQFLWYRFWFWPRKKPKQIFSSLAYHSLHHHHHHHFNHFGVVYLFNYLLLFIFLLLITLSLAIQNKESEILDQKNRSFLSNSSSLSSSSSKAYLLNVNAIKSRNNNRKNITDLIVKIGENVILECDDNHDRDDLEKHHHHHHHKDHHHHYYYYHHHLHPNRIESLTLKRKPLYQYYWCRYEQDDWPRNQIDDEDDDDDFVVFDLNNNNNTEDNNDEEDDDNGINYRVSHRKRQSNRTRIEGKRIQFDHHHHHHHHQQQHHREKHESIMKHKTCFEGEHFLIINENQMSTIIYRCEIRMILDKESEDQNLDDYFSSHKSQSTSKSPPSSRSSMASFQIISNKLFKLYVDQFPQKVQQKRAIREFPAGNRRRCRPPRCKPYASVLKAQCSSIELQIRYPSNQYGYNHSIDHWGTIYCNDQVLGYQIWLIGYGIVKKFHPSMLF
ncbi:hypothetical protein SSS_08137 [Sarcoptes scabiei]|uniref:Uncharacterized protein n=1 Tax=Sarcoptes scabiei TaxID=52283 RepID=A0A834VG40_SARSC|nr:hypothetical protein SSS_08137 [Sarcoptes scabiei]